MEQNEQKKSEQKTAQVLYMTVILVLGIMAVAVGLTTAAGKKNKPVETTPEASSAAVTTSHTTAHLPILTSPVQPGTTAPASTTAPAGTTQTTRSVAEADAPVPTLPVFIMPTIGNVSKGYTIDALVWSNTMEDYRTHDGIDICAGAGEGVMAAADGIVTVTNGLDSWGGSYGYYIQIDHGGGLETLYAHCSSICVTTGQQVQAGEVIGYVGHTGRATGNHLHFEVHINGVRRDAETYFTI